MTTLHHMAHLSYYKRQVVHKVQNNPTSFTRTQ